MSTSPRSGRIRTLSASSRARRDQRHSVRRRRRLAAGGAALAALIAAPLSINAFMGFDSAFVGLDAAKSLMALLEDRSPGDRTAAELTKTKEKAAPEQRALGKVRKPETPPEFESALAPPPPSLTDIPSFPVALGGLGPLVEIPNPPRGGGGIVIMGGPPGGGGGGGGGGGDNPPTENPPTENPPSENPPPPPPDDSPPENPPPPPPPVVPEPGTWATMLLGFGLTGWMMRRRRRTERETWA